MFEIIWSIPIFLWDWFFGGGWEILGTLFLLLLGVITLHHNSNTNKVKLFRNTWNDVGDRLDDLQRAFDIEQKSGITEEEDRKKIKHWTQRTVNSFEFLALCYKKNLVHRGMCREYLPAVLDDFLNRSTSPLYEEFHKNKAPKILRDTKLMEYSMRHNGFIAQGVEFLMPIPVVGTILLRLYNSHLERSYDKEKIKPHQRKQLPSQ